MAGPLRVEPDVEVARWLQRALHPLDGTVAGTMPPVFDAYARILHPATLSTPTGETDAWGGRVEETREITWAEAAALIGERAARSEPWTAWLARFGADQIDVRGGAWVGSPYLGDIPLPLLAALAGLLLEEHGDADVLAAVWEGSGLDPSGSGVMLAFPPGTPPWRRWREQRQAQREHDARFRAVVDPEVSAAIAEQRVLGLPRDDQGRGHVLLRGRLASFADEAWVETAGLGWREGEWVDRGRTPNAVWPAEPHAAPAWLIATDLDLDVTFVGGSERLIERILALPALEVERIRSEDPLV